MSACVPSPRLLLLWGPHAALLRVPSPVAGDASARALRSPFGRRADGRTPCICRFQALPAGCAPLAAGGPLREARRWPELPWTMHDRVFVLEALPGWVLAGNPVSPRARGHCPPSSALSFNPTSAPSCSRTARCGSPLDSTHSSHWNSLFPCFPWFLRPRGLVPDVVLAPQGASVCATRPLLSARPLSRLLLASPRQPRLWVLVLLETCLLWRATSPSGPLTSLGCTFPARPCGLSPHWPLFP